MRVKRGVKARKRRNRVLKLASGFRGRSGNTIRQASSRVDKAMRYMYRDRKKNKGNFRALWIARISAAVSLMGMSYSRFTHSLKVSNIELDRRMLAKLGAEHPVAFKAVVDAAGKGSEIQAS